MTTAYTLYNLDYYEEMLKRNSKTAERIAKIRWKFISKVSPRVILDYGSGCGWFRAYRPKGVIVDTFDIGQYPQTGIKHDFYSLVCFWDVLEHLSSISEIELALNMTKFVAISVPIKPDKQVLKTWKHFKPGEHLNYFTESSLSDIFNEYNFRCLIKGYPECPPRQDILSIIYERVWSNLI